MPPLPHSLSALDSFTRDLDSLLEGYYESIDRITLNGYFCLGSTSGGLLQ